MFPPLQDALVPSPNMMSSADFKPEIGSFDAGPLPLDPMQGHLTLEGPRGYPEMGESTPVPVSILLVDDEAGFSLTCKLLQEISTSFASWNYDLEWVDSYDAALQAMERRTHDIYLIDYELGLEARLELLKQINAKSCSIPLLLMARHNDLTVYAEAAHIGAVDYLAKDQIDAISLERAIRYALHQKRAQEQLRAIGQQNAKLLAALSQADIGVVLTDARTQGFPVTYVNPAFTQITGYPAVEVLGQSMSFLQGSDSSQKAIDAIATALRENISCRVTLLNARKDGTSFWNDVQISPVNDEQGHIVAHVGFLHDVSSQIAAQSALRESQANLEAAQRLTHLGSFNWDLKTRVLNWSDEFFRIFGFEPHSLEPHWEHVASLLSPWQRKEAGIVFQKALRTGEAQSWTVHIKRPDGAWRWIVIHARAEYDEKGQPSNFFGSAQDVTENIEAQNALRESEQRYALAARGTNDGLWDWDLQTDHIYYSPRWKAMSGWEETEIGNSTSEWFGRVHQVDIERLDTNLKLHLSGKIPLFECEYRLLCRDGAYRWMLGRGLAVVNDAGEPCRIAGSQTDISAHKQAEALLAQHAFCDTLTGLPNRSLFIDRLNLTIARAARAKDKCFAVLFLDLDQFKKINDSLGHMVGDQLLLEVAQRFTSCLRPSDTVARFGGDEFAILLDELEDVQHIRAVAERIHHELERPFNLNDREVFVTASIGIALITDGDIGAEELMRNADTAMYWAKGRGRARHEVFDTTMHQRAVKMLELESALWRALERSEFLVYYQPIIDLEQGKICGCEALVRWQHPERGVVPPGDFIPLAEETGLIVPMGWWVLRESCRQAREWNELYPETPLWVAVNLSSKQFSQVDMIEQVQGALEESGLPPELLKLEITESVIMENTDSASEMLERLKSLGIHLSMDDFGTGYSSFSYLHRFPVDTLKIDRSFIAQIEMPTKSGHIVRTLISLAQNLGMDVVAEGVEKREQVELLRQMQCGFAQGYHFSRPVPSHELMSIISQSPQW